MLRSRVVTTWDVRCPRCDRRAAAAMVADRAKGSYRQPRAGLRCERITCVHCGLIRELGPAQGHDVELWYRATVGGRTVWATTRQHLDFLVAWMTGEVDEHDLPWWDADEIETLPSWLKEHRAEAAAKLLALPHD